MFTKRKYKTTKAILTHAYELLKDKENWARGTMWADANGNPTTPEAAVKACALGAVRLYGEDYLYSDEAARVLDKVAEELYPAYGDLVSVNDDKGHKAILRLFERALGIEVPRNKSTVNRK